MTQKKTKPPRYGDEDPADRRSNPFMPPIDEDEDSPWLATPYHRYKSADGRTIEYVRHVDDHVGFLRVLILPEPKDLPDDLKGPWCGYGDCHKRVVQFFEGKGVKLSILSPHEAYRDPARLSDDHITGRDYAASPRRFDTR